MASMAYTAVIAAYRPYHANRHGLQKDLPFFEHIWPNVQGKFAREFEILRALLAEQARAAAAVDEPPLPVSRERFVPQPLRAR
jgi:hypothetical protein